MTIKRKSTYGKPALHKKRRFQLAIAKAQKISATNVPNTRPLSVPEKLTQIFGPDTRSSPSEMSAANPKIAPAGTPGTVSIFTPSFQNTTSISGDKGKEEKKFPKTLKNNIGKVVEKVGSSEPEQEDEFSALYMGTPTETSTPIKKDIAVITAEPENNNHVSSPTFKSACFESFSSLTVISNNESQLQVHEESIGLNNVFSPAAAKSTRNETFNLLGSMSHAAAKEIKLDIVFEGLLKLTEAGLEVRLFKNKSQAQIPLIQRPLTLKTRKRRRVKLSHSHFTKYRKKKKTKAMAIKTPKSDFESLQNDLSPKSELHMKSELPPLSRDKNTSICLPMMSKTSCCNKEEGKDEIPILSFEEQKNMLNINSDKNNSFTNLDSHTSEIPSQSVSIKENEHISELKAEEMVAHHLEKIEETSKTENFKPPQLLSQYQFLLSQCAPGPDPIDLIGRRRMRT